MRLGSALAWSVPWLSFFMVSLAADSCVVCPAGMTHLSVTPCWRLYPAANFEHCWLDAVLHVSSTAQPMMSVHSVGNTTLDSKSLPESNTDKRQNYFIKICKNTKIIYNFKLLHTNFCKVP